MAPNPHSLALALVLGLVAGTAASAEPEAGPQDGIDVLSEVLTLGRADSLLERSYRHGEESRAVEVAAGETLLSLFARQEVPMPEAHAAIAALEGIYDPRRLQIGQEITFRFAHAGRSSTFLGLMLMPDVERFVAIERNAEGGFVAAEIENVLEARQVAARGTIDSSLLAATNAAGVPDQVLMGVVRAFAYDVDFQRDIHSGDGFELLFEQEFHEDGELARNGDMIYAALILNGRRIPIYRFESADGTVDYYDGTGKSVRRALLRTPVDGFRISSRFGMRRHPILGYSRMHRGVDFAAPSGTPIYAAGDGVVDFIGRNRGYGNYIRLNHGSGMATAYAHQSRFARGLSRGDRVTQGQVIGYVGSTGQSTGPHLHYEVLRNGSQVNPLSINVETGRTLEGQELAAFRARVAEIDSQFELLAPPAAEPPAIAFDDLPQLVVEAAPEPSRPQLVVEAAPEPSRPQLVVEAAPEPSRPKLVVEAAPEPSRLPLPFDVPLPVSAPVFGPN